MMLPKLTDPRPMVRTITCWAIFRYSSWMLEGAVSVSAAAVAPLLSSSMQGILHCIKDHNRFVQHAALTSIATVVEEAVNVDQVSQLTPFLKVRLSYHISLFIPAVLPCNRISTNNISLYLDPLISHRMMPAAHPRDPG